MIWQLWMDARANPIDPCGKNDYNGDNAMNPVYLKGEIQMKVVYTDKAPAAIGPYSQAIVLNGVLFTSGQIPVIPATGELAGDTIEAQAEQVMKNLGAVLEEAGTSFEKAVKTTCFLADMGDFAAFNEIYAKYFVNKPARSCVAVKTLPKNVLCEVEVIAEI